MDQTLSASPGTRCQGDFSCKNYELIRQFTENPNLIKRYLRHLHHCYLQDNILQGQEKKKIWEEMKKQETHSSA